MYIYICLLTPRVDVVGVRCGWWVVESGVTPPHTIWVRDVNTRHGTIYIYNKHTHTYIYIYWVWSCSNTRGSLILQGFWGTRKHTVILSIWICRTAFITIDILFKLYVIRISAYRSSDHHNITCTYYDTCITCLFKRKSITCIA